MVHIQAWELLEKLQSFSYPAITQNLGALISISAKDVKVEISKLKLTDIGCGSGNLVSGALDIIGKIYCYNGVDIDQSGLNIIRQRGINSYHMNLFKKDAIKMNFDADIYICLSNTFLAIGDWKDLDNLLLRMFENNKKAVLILSLVPWDDIRKKWHENYTEWVRWYYKNDKMKMRSKELEDNLKVYQTLEIENSDEIYTFKHEFMKTTFESFRSFIEKRGLIISDWLNPHTLETIDTQTFELPEVWVTVTNI